MTFSGNRYLALVMLCLATLLGSTAARACSSCGCTLNSDWITQGYATGTGTRLDLRFDWFSQNDYRHGRDAVSRSDTAAAGSEVQDTTINRNLTLGLDHSFDADWGINLQLPVFNRSHETYGEAYPSRDEWVSSHSRGIGDARITGRYQGLSADRGTGVTFGLKLPTGETDDTFKDGSPLDRGLQLGTGTTDLLLGGYRFGNLDPDWGYFAQATAQIALNSHDHFRPGNGLNASAGVRYMGLEQVIPQLQLNARVEKRESGAQADKPNSGASLLYLSPGLTVPVGHRMQVYGFFQVPIYQRVNGYQIEPRYFLSGGLSYSF